MSGTPPRRVAELSLVLIIVGGWAGAAGQSGNDTSADVAAGARYNAGWLHRLLFGGQYRDLWRQPIRVPYLELDTIGGGLTPTTAGGRFQTLSLRFRGVNGHLYGFRSVDKVPSVLPPELTETFLQDLIQDQTSSAHPAGAGIVAPLALAVGVLQVDPILRVLPDDPVLGEHRELFAGLLGYFELRAVSEPGAQRFAGADEIIDSDELYPLLQASPDHQVDARRYLAARLLDLYIGDWDRHRGQWGWARFGTGPVTRWVPIPEDRDQAFSRYDGLMLTVARLSSLPQLGNFGDHYPRDLFGATWVGSEADRWFLVPLERAVWDSVVTAVQSRLTDSVIDAAVARMPAGYQAIDGPSLREALRRRRDGLPAAADRYYRLLLEVAEIHDTDVGELVTIDRQMDGSVRVTLARRTAETSPYLTRTFVPAETREVRVYLYEGDDRVVVRGPGRGIGLRIIGGGTDEVVDSSAAGGVRFYARGADRVTGPTRVRVDRRSYPAPPRREDPVLAPRDWGRRSQPMLWSGFGPDVGVFAGGGTAWTEFGFRNSPFARRIAFRAGYATGARTGRGELTATFRRSNSRVRLDVYGRASGIEVLRYHGLGNETTLDRPADYYRVNQKQYTLQPSVTLPLGAPGSLTLGPIVTYTNTRRQAGRIIEATQPYGTGGFGQMGGRAGLRVDTRDVGRAATRGVLLEIGGSAFPGWWDVRSAFGEVHGSLSTYLSVGEPPGPGATLAVRAGGKKVWGTFPFHEAAFLGDEATARFGVQNRFAGDAAAWGNAELRLRLARTFILLPGHAGVLGLADVGRTYLSGETSNVWHHAFGGGVWMSFIQPGNAVSLAVAATDERAALYVRAGFAY